MKKEKNKTVYVGARVNELIVNELDQIAKPLFSNRNSILNECLKLGVEEFKKKNAKLVEAIKERKE